MQKHIIGLLVWLLIAACSNDSVLEGISSNDTSLEARIDEAALDLDRGAYDQVINELSVIYNTTTPNPSVSRLLASAYMGKAGIDLTDLILATTLQDLIPFNVMSTLITPNRFVRGTNARFIDNQTISSNLANLDMAMNILQVLMDRAGATPDDALQLGVASAAHFLMYLGDNTADALSDKHGVRNAPINSWGYQYFRTDDENWHLISPKTFYNRNAIGPSPYQDDMLNICHAISAITNSYQDPNGLRDALDEYLHSILGIGLDIAVTDELILSYSSTGIHEFVQRLAIP